jgi:acetyltransferase-like isoleucine patch superfamily enzyme
MNLEKYDQYKSDIFNKLNFPFEAGKKMLDCGCGNGIDSEIFINEFGLETCGIDVYKDKNIDKIKGLTFKEAGIYNIPFNDDEFDYVFLHDVLHHIDEKNQSRKKHLQALDELKRVVKKNGKIIIVEGNRYNPLFYPHMVKMRGHNHFKQSYFKEIVSSAFNGYKIEFKFFECHLYPKNFLWFWKIYEKIMERYVPSRYLAYNVAVINSGEKDGSFIYYDGRVPKKNLLIQFLLILQWPLAFSFFRWIINAKLKNCENTGYIPGMRFLYGNIYAENAFLCDTFFVDYAPIYIGDGARFSFDNMIITSTHSLKDFKKITAKPVWIGKNVWVTSRCIIMPGVKIGDNSVISAGSIVRDDIPANCIAAGNPAKVVKYLE